MESQHALMALRTASMCDILVMAAVASAVSRHGCLVGNPHVSRMSMGAQACWARAYVLCCSTMRCRNACMAFPSRCARSILLKCAKQASAPVDRSIPMYYHLTDRSTPVNTLSMSWICLPMSWICLHRLGVPSPPAHSRWLTPGGSLSLPDAQVGPAALRIDREGRQVARQAAADQVAAALTWSLRATSSLTSRRSSKRPRSTQSCCRR